MSDPFHLQGAQSVLDAWDFSYHPEENILEFLRRCKEWQDAHKDDPEAPAVFSQYAWEYLEQNLFSIIGADCIDYDKKTAEISVPEIVEIMSLLRDLQSDVVESVFVFPNEIEEQYGAFLFGGYLGAYDVTMYAEDNGVRDGLVSAHPEHRTALMPLRTLDGKVNAGAQFYLMVPAMASNQVNGVKYIAQLLKIMQEDEMFTSNIGFVEYPANAGTEQVKKKNQTLSSYGNAEFSEVFERIYADRGAIRMPDYWMPGAQSLLDNYMKGSCSPEDVVKQLDERLKIYVSE